VSELNHAGAREGARPELKRAGARGEARAELERAGGRGEARAELKRADGPRRRRVVAMVSDAIYPYHRGGKELRYHELTQRLADRADVHMYTMHWWRGPRTRAEGLVTCHAISPLLPLYVGERRSLSQPLRFAASCLRLLRREFDVLEADHIPFLQILPLRLIASIRGKRLVVTWHEVWGRDDWRTYLGRAGLAAWLIERLAMRLPDHILAASPQTADRLTAILRDRVPVTVAPNGIDLAEVDRACPDTATSDLVVVGRLMGHKRVDMLLDAVALLHASGRPVTCRVIGDGPERTALHARAQALGVSGAVEFRHDVQEQKDVYALVKAARVAVFPSAREGFGIAVLEALACGLPVVTTSTPDNLARHLVARSARGVVCEPSAASIAAAIRRLLDGDGAEAGEHAPPEAWLAEYSWDAMVTRVADALRV
jgi:glycosyltransferase involved in cell wall biosynthesis